LISCWYLNTDGTIAKADAQTSKSDTALEVQRQMLRIGFQQRKVLVCQRANRARQGFVETLELSRPVFCADHHPDLPQYLGAHSVAVVLNTYSFLCRVRR
jgi:hypothetical protein